MSGLLFFLSGLVDCLLFVAYNIIQIVRSYPRVLFKHIAYILLSFAALMVFALLVLWGMGIPHYTFQNVEITAYTVGLIGWAICLVLLIVVELAEMRAGKKREST